MSFDISAFSGNVYNSVPFTVATLPHRITEFHLSTRHYPFILTITNFIHLLDPNS